MTHTEEIDCIRHTARDAGFIPRRWDYRKRNFELIAGDCTIKGHWNIHDLAWSVCTTLKHPKKGERPMWRNFLTHEEVIKVIMHPREHICKPISFQE
jgi:hypothetical protein